MRLDAVIFDLDGVITDTAEYHYLGWQRLADEEGLHFNRKINERLRGLSRRDSLLVILEENQDAATPAQIEAWMERKNRYYVESLENITPNDLLPGAKELIQELRAANIRVAIGSASKNAATVIDRLGIRKLIDVVADGHNAERNKPAPDLFIYAANQLGVHPAFCAVIEDAEAGVEAALAAGMWAIGLGPEQRVAKAHARYDNLEDVHRFTLLTDLESAAWSVVEPSFDPQTQHHKETIFTTGNGYFCTRGSLEEGYPGDMPASFVHRLWDDIPVHYTELANIPSWIKVDIWVNGKRFRFDQGELSGWRRWLDLRTGVLRRRVKWQPAPDGPTVVITFERFANLASAHSAALRCQVRMLEGSGTVRIRSGLDDHVENTGRLHWDHIDQSSSESEVWLLQKTRSTKSSLAMAAAFQMQAPAGSSRAAYDADGQPEMDWNAEMKAGEALSLDKFVGIASAREADDPVREALNAARTGAERGFAAIYAENEAEWSKLWAVMDVQIEGDIEAQLALRFNIFQLAIASPRFTDRTSIGAKTLSGFGYRHHIFWDCEIFILPLFTFTQPELARNMLTYRYHTLPGARQKARRNGYEGAQFAWESAEDGSEVTPVWVVNPEDPANLIRIWTGDIEIHITADIAYAAVQYWQITGDDAWMRDYGAEIILEGARFWASALKLEDDGKYHLRDVIGPDEYHDHVDDNAYTNYLAKWHLKTARGILTWLAETFPDKQRDLRRKLSLDEAQLKQWTEISEHIHLAIKPESGLIEQFDGYFKRLEPDFGQMRDPARRESMYSLLGSEGCADTQILKQPDVLMLQYLLPDEFTPEQVRKNYAFYDPRTDHEHGSSLGPAISAILAARAGDIENACQHFMRAARADLFDVRHNASDGIHAASAGGLWQATVFGFGGLHQEGGEWMADPHLPAHWVSLSFKFYHRGQLQTVQVSTDKILLKGGEAR